MILEPGDISIIRRSPVHAEWKAIEGRHGARIHPPMDFRVAVAEGEPASEMVIETREILVKSVLRWAIGVAGHIGAEVAPVDLIFPLVQKEEGLNRPGRIAPGYVAELKKQSPTGQLERLSSESAEVEIHRDRSNTWFLFSLIHAI